MSHEPKSKGEKKERKRRRRASKDSEGLRRNSWTRSSWRWRGELEGGAPKEEIRRRQEGGKQVRRKI